MNPLDIAESARVTECGLYQVQQCYPFEHCEVVMMGQPIRAGTRAECEAWIARRGNVAFVKALAEDQGHKARQATLDYWTRLNPGKLIPIGELNGIVRAALLALVEASDV